VYYRDRVGEVFSVRISYKTVLEAVVRHSDKQIKLKTLSHFKYEMMKCYESFELEGDKDVAKAHLISIWNKGSEYLAPKQVDILLKKLSYFLDKIDKA
jgi:hypothetical protein